MFNKINKFSLIELIVVIAILGILSSIVVPNIKDFRTKAEVTQTQSNIRTIQTAVDMYYVDKESYPTFTQPTIQTPQSINFNLLYPEYLKEIPTSNQQYWIDYQGQVWGSFSNIPEIKGQGTSIISWEALPNVNHYQVFELVESNGTTSTRLVSDVVKGLERWAYIGQTKYTPRELIEADTSLNSNVIQFYANPEKQYLVSARDTMGFYTPPASREVKTPVTIEDGLLEKTIYLKTSIDGIANWFSLSDKKIVPNGTSINYEFSSSKNLSTQTKWFTDIKDVPDSDNLTIKIILKGSEAKKPTLEELKINFNLSDGEVKSCSLNLSKDNQNCNTSKNKHVFNSKVISVNKIIKEGEKVNIPIPADSQSNIGNYILSTAETYSGSGDLKLYFSDGSSSFQHAIQGNPTEIVLIAENGDVLVEDIVIHYSEVEPILETLNTKQQDYAEWNEIQKVAFKTEAKETVTWTRLEFTQDKENNDNSRLRAEIVDTNLTDYKSGSSINKQGKELQVNFIGELKSDVNDDTPPQPEEVVVFYQTPDGTEDSKKYLVTENTDGNLDFSEVSNNVIKQVEMGSYHSLILTKEGKVYSWGQNAYGQLGDGTTVNKYTPSLVSSLADKNIVKVAAAGYYSLALTADGEVYGWGNNSYGQSAEVLNGDVHEPTVISSLSDKGIVQIYAGENHAMALTNSGEVYGWGNNTYGQLGNSSYANSSPVIHIPNYSNKNIKQLSLGTRHTVALTQDGDVYATGSNEYGQLGNTTPSKFTNPTKVYFKVNETIKIKQISAGGLHTFALSEDGTVYTFGYGGSGQLGLGTTGNANTPRIITTLSDKNIVQVVASNDNGLAVTSDGQVYSWGSNMWSQIGDGSAKNQLSPVLLTSLSNIDFVNMFKYNGLAISKDGEIYSWGSNSYGQLGTGNTTTQSRPVLISLTE